MAEPHPRKARTTTRVTGASVLSAHLRELSKASGKGLQRAEAGKLREAARPILDAAKASAGAYSARIPASLSIGGGGRGVFIVANGSVAPNAAPFEIPERHPLWATGPRSGWQWRVQPHRPFLEIGAEQGSAEAMRIFATVIDDWTRQLGWK